MNNKTCIVYNCHIINEETIRRYNHIKSSISEMNMDIIWGIDTTFIKNDFKFPEEIDFFKVDQNTLEDHKTLKFIPRINLFGHPIMWTNSNNLYILTLNEKYPQYDYIWQIEYDVCYSGNWKNFFCDFQNNDSDFIAYDFMNYDQCRDWCWWRECGYELPSKFNWRKSINVIMRMSRKSIDCAKKFLEEFNGSNQIFFEYGLISSSDKYNLTTYDIKGKYTGNVFITGKVGMDRLTNIEKNKLYHGIPDNILWEELMISKGICI